MPHESSHPSSETIRLMRTMRAEGATIGKIAQRFSLTLDETRRHVDADEQDKQVKSTNAPPTILTVFQNRTVKAPSSPEQAIAWLREVATHLETYPYASNSFRFTAQAIREFLSGKNPSLEHALKLNKKRGVPGNPESRRRMAVTVHQLKKSGKSKREIQEALEQQGEESLRPLPAYEAPSVSAQ